MAETVIPNTWRVALIFEFEDSGYRAQTTFAVLDMASHDAARANEIAAATVAWWEDNVKVDVHPTCSLVEIYVLDLSSLTGPGVVYDTGLPVPGTSTGAPGPANAAPIITLRTALRGRSYRGRMFIPGMAAQAYEGTDGTKLTAGYVTDMQTAGDNLISAISAIDGTPELAVASRQLGSSSVVISTEARTYIGTQRRRVKSP